MDDEFLLESRVASDLYHQFAEPLPIIDFHSHLAPEQLASDHRFRSITEIWLDGDHYKWRAMRANGVAERYITGDASDWERFEAWARTVPDTLRNPLYHWTHLELRRAFGIDAQLSPATSRAIFDRCNERLREDGFTMLGMLRSVPRRRRLHHRRSGRFAGVAPRAGGLSRTRRRASIRRGGRTRFWPSRIRRAFNAWVARLEAASARAVGGRLASLLDALRVRYEAFHELGCRAVRCRPRDDGRRRRGTTSEVDDDFDRLRCGQAAGRRPARGA